MSHFTQKFLGIFTCVVLYAPRTSALKCYSCDASFYPGSPARGFQGCFDQVEDSSLLQDCATYCMEFYLTDTSQGSRSISRLCAPAMPYFDSLRPLIGKCERGVLEDRPTYLLQPPRVSTSCYCDRDGYNGRSYAVILESYTATKQCNPDTYGYS